LNPEPVLTTRFELEDFLSGISPEQLYSSLDTGEPVGVEIS
jgi:hypothetical protein